MKLADLYVEYRAKGQARIEASLNSVHRKLRAAESAVVHFAAAFRKVFMVSAGVIGGTTYAAAKFEDQLAMVSTMLDESTMKHMAAYKKGLSAMSAEFAEGTGTLSKGLYDILSASVPAEKAMDVLRTSVIAAKAGMTDTATSARAIVAVMNSYQIPVEKAAIVSDKLFATVKKGVLNFPELANSIGKAAATSARAGLSLDELLATVATVTRAGISADEAMTAIVGTLRSFFKPTTEGAKAARELGFELKSATLRTEGLSGVMKKLNDLTIDQLAVIFPNIRGIKGVAAAMADAEGYAENLELQMRAGGKTAEAFAKATNTLTFKLGQLKQEFFAAARELGEEFVPAMERKVKLLKEAVGWFRKLSPETKSMIARIIGLTAALSDRKSVV